MTIRIFKKLLALDLVIPGYETVPLVPGKVLRDIFMDVVVCTIV